MNQLLQFWTKRNYHLSRHDASTLYGITNLESAVSELIEKGVPVRSETRTDLGESFARYYLGCTCESGQCYLHTINLNIP